MIKSIRLQNFFSFQDCTINLNPGVNVLVGVNGSGKSNLLKAIRLIQRGLKLDLHKAIFSELGGFNAILNLSNSQSRSFSVSLSLNSRKQPPENSLNWKINIERGVSAEYLVNEILTASDLTKEETVFEREGTQIMSAFGNRPLSQAEWHELIAVDYAPEIFEDYFNAVADCEVYDRFDLSPSGYARRGSLPDISPKLKADGSNLPSLLSDFKFSYPSAYQNIEHSLRKVNEKFSHLDFRLAPNAVELWMYETEFDKPINAINISDGTLRFLCLMAILYNPNRGQLICLDEPENGLHPDMLHTVAEAIQYAAKTSQIIISTHSPQLLNWFTFEDIRVFEKDENNATIVKELKQQEFEGWYDTYLLGDMWMKGNIGGNRW